MSGQVSRGSAGEYQADERAGVGRLSWRVSGRCVGRCRAAPLARIRQMSGQVSRGSGGEYQADERAGVARLQEAAALPNLEVKASHLSLLSSLGHSASWRGSSEHCPSASAPHRAGWSQGAETEGKKEPRSPGCPILPRRSVPLCTVGWR